MRVSKPVRLQGEELRDLPLYTIADAARILAIPARTLAYWFSGPDPMYKPAKQYASYSLLSFRDVAEAYMLFVLREFYGFPPNALRQYLRALRRETTARHPLLDSDIKTLGKTLIYDKPARGRRPRQLIDLSGARQFAIGEVVDTWGKRIIQDDKRNPLQLLPWRLFAEDRDSSPVSIDPDVMSGNLVVTGTRVPVSMLAAMKRSGKDSNEIAEAYNLSPETVKKAIQHVERPIHKKAA